MAPAFYTLFIFDQLGKEKSSFPLRFAVRRRRENNRLSRERGTRASERAPRPSSSRLALRRQSAYVPRRVARQSQERAHAHPHFHSPTSVSLPSRHRRRLAVRRFAQTLKSCSLETSFLQSRGSKRAGLKRFIFLAIPTNGAIDRRDPDSVSPRGGDVQRPKTASRRGDPSPRARAKILDACAPLAARATSRAVRS